MSFSGGNISLVLQYGCMLSPEETNPTIDIHVDGDVDTLVDQIALPINDPARRISVIIPRTAHLVAASSDGKLPKHAKIVFYASCWRKNEQGTPCRVDAGLGTINLEDAVSGATAGAFLVPLLLYTCNKFEKGRLMVSFPSAVSGLPTIDKRSLALMAPVSAKVGYNGQGNGLYDHLHLKSYDTYPGDTEPSPAVEEEAAAYIKNIMRYETAMPNTDKDTANVRVPIYYGDVGMTRRVPLPAAAFMLFRTPRSNLKYWTNLAAVCMARDGKNVYDIMHSRRMDLTQRARLMVEMCCALVQALDYIGDIFDMNRRFTQRVEGFLSGSPDVVYNPAFVKGCERFGDALRDKTGDCEDLALAIIMIWCALIDAGEGGMFGAPDHAYLREMVRIARQYVPFVTLDSVMAMAVKAKEDQGRDATSRQKRGAHMAVKFLPCPNVREAIVRCDTEMATRHASAIPFYPEEPDANQLPILVGEGTGMFECWGLIVDPISGERSYVYSHLPSLAVAKKPIVHPPHADSSFYVGSMVGLTPYWFRQGYNLGGVWFGYTGRHADPAIGPTDGSIFHRGVKFSEMDRGSKRMCILPHPTFSESLMEWMRVCTKIRVPPRDLVLTEQGVMKHAKRLPGLDSVSNYAERMNRKRTVEHDPAPAYIQEHHATPSMIEGLKREIERSELITGFGYDLEHLTDWAHTYRIRIYANTTNQ